jgi:hypothetical protein
MVAAVLTAFAAFFLSTRSPFALMLPAVFLGSLLLPQRFERDSATIWGVRLLVYATFAVLGRTPTGAPGYFVDAQAFTTAGLIAGGELLLQAFRRPPEGARFDGWIVSLSGVIFLIACNTFRPHIWVLAPLFMLCLLLALPDLRPRAASRSALSNARRIAMIGVAVFLGTTLHLSLWANRNSIMSLGAQLLSNSSAATSQTASVNDNPQLSSSFAGGTSTARLLRIKGRSTTRICAQPPSTFIKMAPGGHPFPNAPSARRCLVKRMRIMRKISKWCVAARSAPPKSPFCAKVAVLCFCHLNAWAFIPEEGQSFDWDRFQGPVKTEEPAPVSYYVIDSKTQAYGFEIEQGPLCVAPDAAQRAALMAIPPEIDPEVSRLAERIAQEGATQPEKAALIVDYLFTTNKYSLEFVRGEQDPISDFVLNKKSAHCQYFASATAIMLRAVGVPARYVTGYYAHESEEGGGTIVRGRDAHAWTEAYFDGVGWVMLDATPPSGRADPAVSPLPPYQKPLEALQDTFARVRVWFGNLTQIQILGIIGVVLLLWGLERWRQHRKTARKRALTPVPPPELAPLARRFEKLLAKRGITLAAGRPWSETLPDELQNERSWVDGYNRARFYAAQTEEIRELEAELKKLEKIRS